MKHGDKAKSKKASKASGKKSSKGGTKTKVAAKSSQAKKQAASSKAEKQTGKAGNNGKPRTRITPDSITFTNPIVANAFKRAVKKYPNAFRRLTD